MSGFRAALTALALAAMAATVSGPGRQVQAAPRPMSMEVRLVAETPETGVLVVTHPTTGQTILLEGGIELTNSDISSTEVEAAAGSAAIILHLNEHGSEVLSALHQGQQLRRLAILIDGEAVYVPFLTADQPSDRLVIRTHLSAEEASQIASGLGAG